MKITALAVVILAFGIVVGFALAGGASEGPASAAPQCPGPSAHCATPTPTPPPQKREDQITIFSDGSPEAIGARVVGFGSYGLLQTNGMVRLRLGAGRYPSSTVFRLETVLSFGTPIGDPTTICLRLFDLTASTPVFDSEVCHTVAGGSETVRVRSATHELATAEHEYTLQGKTSNKGATVGAARIIAEWTE